MSLKREIILVDGTAFLFRAYHAFAHRGGGGLATADGRATQAVFGVINMLRKLMKEREPQYIAVVMDAKGPTFRNEMFADYKAHRPPMPEDLVMQMDYVLQIVPAMGLPLLRVPGVEADDVIGTLAKAASKKKWRSLIVSSDKDLMQLVDARTEMIDTMKNTRFDAAGVEKKFGVPPDKMIEYLALVGDSSDNVPGVPMVGPKTAVNWLNQYGSLKKLIASADDIKGKVGENLRGNLAQLELSRQLVTLKCDVKLDVTLDDLQPRAPDKKTLRKLFTDLEFRSWLRDLGADAGAPAEANAEAMREVKLEAKQDALPEVSDYEIILDLKTLRRWIKKLRAAEIFSLDTETTSIDAHRAQLVGVSFAVAPGDAAYLPLAHNYAGAPAQVPIKDALDALRPLLEDAKAAKTGQNLKYDLEVLRYAGIELRGVTHDTMLMSYLLDAGNFRHDLEALALKHLGHRMITFADVAGKGKKQLTFDQIPLQQAAQYAAEDADITLQLHHILAPKIDASENFKRLFNEVEMPLLSVLAEMECSGVEVNAVMLHKHGAEIGGRLQKLELEIHECAGEEFNIASPKQIREILFDKQGLPVIEKTSTGQPSTAENVMHELARKHELPRLILQHRSLAKLKGTYTDKLPQLINPKSRRIHTSYHQAVAATGRLSSSDPNLQNIPARTEEGRRIREAFIAKKNYKFLSADYSQIELRIMAHLSADKNLVRAFADGLDVHAATAAEVFGGAPDTVNAEQRRRAKAINFGLIYGMSAFGLARQLDIEHREAKQYIEIYFQRYPGVREYMDKTKAFAREHGYVETLYGRRLNLPEIHSKNAPRRQYAERTAINAPMQGSAADLIKIAMLKVHEWIIANKSQSRIILQVHDELVLETPTAEAKQMAKVTAELMCGIAELRVPLVADTGIGKNWKQAH